MPTGEPALPTIRRPGLLWEPALILFASAVLIFSRLNGALLEPEEGRYAEIPRQMLVHHRILVPVLDGQDYLDKPPLLYWSVMACYAAFGPEVWAARLVPCLCAWLSVVVAYLWVRRTECPSAGVAASAVLTVTADFIYRGPMLTMNGPLGLCVLSSLAAGHIAVVHARRPLTWWVMSAVACGLGVLTKGPVAFALAAVPLTSLMWVWRVPIGQAIWMSAVYAGAVLLVAAPWFVAVTSVRTDFVEYFFWRHHVERVTAPFDHAKPFWFYLPAAGIGFLPWSVALVWTGVRYRLRSNWPPADSPEWFAMLVGAWGLLLFSLSGSKRPVYLVPIWPPLATGVGIFMHRTLCERSLRVLGLSSRGWRWAGGLTFGLIAAGVFLWLPGYSDRFSMPRQALCGSGADAHFERELACYPHGWESVEFYARREDILVYRSTQLAQLISHLQSHPHTLVVVRAGADAETLMRSLPPDLQLVGVEKTGLALVMEVRPSQSHTPYGSNK